MPPTGNRVLNQIPAGDGRESSREQAVPDDGVPLHRNVSCWGLGDHIPPLILHGLGGRAASLTHKKKKEAGVVWKWRLHTGGEVEAMQVQWNRSGSKEEIVECAGQRQVYTIGISPVVRRE